MEFIQHDFDNCRSFNFLIPAPCMRVFLVKEAVVQQSIDISLPFMD